MPELLALPLSGNALSASKGLPLLKEALRDPLSGCLLMEASQQSSGALWYIKKNWKPGATEKFSIASTRQDLYLARQLCSPASDGGGARACGCLGGWMGQQDCMVGPQIASIQSTSDKRRQGGSDPSAL